MKLTPFAATIGALLIAAPAFAAPSIAGEWNTPDKHGVVRIYQCGEAFCGKVVTGDDIKANPAITDMKNKDESLRSRPMKGLNIFTGLTGRTDRV